MAQKTVVTVLCDMPHPAETESAETVQFAIDGTGYEIDACAVHAKELREGLSGYTQHARRAAQPARARRARRGEADRSHSADVRTWARQHGYKVSERGRIPASIITEYESSH